ncbi:CRISPR-associated protein Cas4 [Corallococcus sp. CA049B]|uniref:CRISPR-associated protein Cas4 n=1 Tax=Corallococcus sp. CA049B TaxID=2316730 RepID=UPI000EA38B69|nr:CRISPR-associated protein Cas4 [Corallococcus sp. CA049B]RKG75193.1 CRISPR-associated protein Cas4 [Corallococcus sp. CA049B]
MSAGPSESDALVPISGLQHLVYCERQAALIHVERVWEEDAATVAGRLFHERVDRVGSDKRGTGRVVRALPLRSERLGLVGQADAVEYHADASVPGGWRPFPVEYKRGRMKSERADRVQLCAQALCLEEMHGVAVPDGALFYGASHRRVGVRFDAALRRETEAAARRLAGLIQERRVPRAVFDARCPPCSLRPRCLPEPVSQPGMAARHLARMLDPEGGE